MVRESSNAEPDSPAIVPRSSLQVLAIQSAADADVLKKARVSLRPSRVLVRVPGLPIEKSLHWELELNTNLRECGCSLGAKFVFIGLAASVVWQFVLLSWGVSDWPWFFVRTIVAMLVSGATGKFLGIALAKARIRRIAKQIGDFAEKSSIKGHDHVDMHKVG